MTSGFRLPDRTYLPAVFERLAFDERDQQEILAAWPSPEADRETWRSLERAYQTLITDMGGFEPSSWRDPPTNPRPSDDISSCSCTWRR